MLLGARTSQSVVTVSVLAGGSGYTAPPSVTFSSGGASAIAMLAGTAIDSVRVVSGGTGYTAAPTVSFSGGGGTGASAVAFVSGATIAPLSFFRGRNGDVYGVDGAGRGIRWNGSDAAVERIGLARPAVPPAVTASSNAVSRFVAGVQIVNAGGGYNAVPSVTITGGSPTVTATAEAYLLNGRVAQIKVTEPGAGYQSPPTVSISGGLAGGASFGVGALGAVRAVTLTADGYGYTTTPAVTISGTAVTCTHHGLTNGSAVTFVALTGASTATAAATFTPYFAVNCASNTFGVATTPSGAAITLTSLTAGQVIIPPPRLQFSTGQGLTGANVRGEVESDGRIAFVSMAAGGTGATTTGVTAAFTGGAGTGASVEVGMQYSVASVTVISGGTGFYTAPVITIRASTNDPYGGGAAVTSTVNASGSVSSVSVAAGGLYIEPPTALVLDTSAKATATLAAPQGGTYQCAIRYIDDTPESAGGPIPSSISELFEVKTPSENGALIWSFTHTAVDARVSAMELWRTTSNQSVLLYRVAKIPFSNFSSTYTDTLTEAQLVDTDRADYGLMPVTLPSGQVNAKRFEVPPSEMAVGCMFQDRAWYAVDTTGQRPNALLYSEIDEPESVPPENELLLQDNVGEPDKIVALIPLSTALLIVQQAHLYRLTYVAQPVLDAALSLAATRGILNSRCWGTMGGAAFIADSLGLYAFDGQNEQPISIAIDNYWRDGIIDFSKSHLFHIRCDSLTKTVRFYYCKSSDSAPARALCYCVSTKTWWEETYPTAITASEGAVINSVYTTVSGRSDGSFVRESGTQDSGTDIPFQIRTGDLALTNDPDRSVSLLYKPTTQGCTLTFGAHYNSSDTPRPNAIASDRGSGFVSAGTLSTLNLAKDRSALGAANGFARAYLSGRLDDRNAGGDRHVAVAFSGTQSQDPVAMYAVTVSGATA